MNKQLQLVEEFHRKFDSGVGDTPTLIPEDRSMHRYHMMRDEVEEYLEGARNGDLTNIAKELADVLYCAYGAIIEHGLQDVMTDVFEEVHRSNMSKDYHEYKMIKGDAYFKADVGKYIP